MAHYRNVSTEIGHETVEREYIDMSQVGPDTNLVREFLGENEKECRIRRYKQINLTCKALSDFWTVLRDFTATWNFVFRRKSDYAKGFSTFCPPSHVPSQTSLCGPPATGIPFSMVTSPLRFWTVGGIPRASKWRWNSKIWSPRLLLRSVTFRTDNDDVDNEGLSSFICSRRWRSS